MRTEPLTKIKVYSNAPKVAVTFNGKPLGDVACVESICEVRDVRLTPGANRVVAMARFDGKDVSDTVDWTLTTP